MEHRRGTPSIVNDLPTDSKFLLVHIMSVEIDILKTKSPVISANVSLQGWDKSRARNRRQISTRPRNGKW